MKSAVLLAAIFLAGCTSGTTPDCAAVQCGPPDGMVPDSTIDAPMEGASDAGADAVEAGSDAPADAPTDG